jgi:hypothetical protein
MRDGVTIVERTDDAACVGFKCLDPDLDPDGHRGVLGAAARPLMRNLQPGPQCECGGPPGGLPPLTRTLDPRSGFHAAAAIYLPTWAAAPSAVTAQYATWARAGSALVGPWARAGTIWKW